MDLNPVIIYSVSFSRYIMVVKVSDASGEGWVSAFNDEAERIIGLSADELDQLKSQVICGEKN